MYVCIRICIYLHIWIHTYINIHIYIYISVQSSKLKLVGFLTTFQWNEIHKLLLRAFERISENVSSNGIGCVHIYIHTHIYIYIYTHVNMYINRYIHKYTYVNIYICTYVYLCVYIYIYIHIYMYMICMCICICIYVYVYAHTHRLTYSAWYIQVYKKICLAHEENSSDNKTRSCHTYTHTYNIHATNKCMHTNPRIHIKTITSPSRLWLIPPSPSLSTHHPLFRSPLLLSRSLALSRSFFLFSLLTADDITRPIIKIHILE